MIGNFGFNFDYDFGPFIREKRKEQDMTMKELGKLVGVSEQAISQYERGVRPLKYSMAEKIMNVLGTNIAEVLFENEQYDEYIPPEFNGDVSAWEQFKAAVDNDYYDEIQLAATGEIKENTFIQVLNELGYQVIGNGDLLRIIYPDGFNLLNVDIQDVAKISYKTAEHLLLLLLQLRYRDNPNVKTIIK